jgi:putative membrane protein
MASNPTDNAAPKPGLRILLGLFTIGGLLLAGFLTVKQGLSSVGAVLATAGWGLLVVTAFHLLQVLMSGYGWRNALAPSVDVPVSKLSKLRWIREAINSTLPVAQIGGEVVGARLLAIDGIPANTATASVVVDTTYEFVTQFIFTVMGLLIYLGMGHNSRFNTWIAVGVAACLPMVLGFVVAQKRGAFHHVERFLNWLATHLPLGLGRMEGLHDSIQQLYSEPRRIVAGCTWHLLSWIAGAVEVWLILYFVGAALGLKEAFIMESLGQAVRTAAFIVPGAFGVQEGGFLLLGSLFGLAPELGLGISLAKRVREYSLGILGLAAWQAIEGRRLFSAPAKDAAAQKTVTNG